MNQNYIFEVEDDSGFRTAIFLDKVKYIIPEWGTSPTSTEFVMLGSHGHDSIIVNVPYTDVINTLNLIGYSVRYIKKRK